MARERGDSVVLIDTAGRLQNRAEPMAELEKIIRVMKKVDPDAPHSVLLALDATVGQNAMSQVEIFGRVAGVTGLVMTKFDEPRAAVFSLRLRKNFSFRFTSSGSARARTTSKLSRRAILPAPSPEWTASGTSAQGLLFFVR